MTEEKLLIARAVANWNRRQVSREEKEEWINGLARLYREQGIAAGATAKKIAYSTGIAYRTVLVYLDDKYKQTRNIFGFSFNRRRWTLLYCMMNGGFLT